MKKFFLTLFILILLGGAGFFFGWAQLTVPPGSYGVMVSKTHGYDQQPVQTGSFRWVWYKLIPTNVKTAVFTLEPVNISINIDNTLPSASTYTSFAGVNANFSWQIRGKVAFNIAPDKLPYLVETHNIMDQQALNDYIQELVEKMKLDILRSYNDSMNVSRLEQVLAGNPDTALEREISQKYPEIRDFSLTLQSVRVPDFVLYGELRSLYQDYLSKQSEIIASGFGARADSFIAAHIRFEELDRYGELLTKYPVLLEYLELENRKKD
jgi:hypothetical protein